MNKIKKNKTLSVLIAMLRTVFFLCASGTLMQTFLIEFGFSPEKSTLHATLIQGVNVGTILLFSHFADTKRPFLRSALVQIPNGLLMLAFLPLCLRAEASTRAFVLLTVIGILQSVCTALNTVCEYKLPYLSYRARDYSTVQAITGVLSAAISFGIGELFHLFKRAVPSYTHLMIPAFVISGLFMVLAGLLTLLFTPISRAEHLEVRETVEEVTVADTAKRVPLREVFSRPIFYLLLPANILRGFSSGALNVFAAVAYTLGFGSDVTTRMVSLAAIANLAACVLFGILSRRISPRLSIFAGSLCFLFLPLCFIPSAPLFLAVYAVVSFGRMVVDVAVPSLLVYAVDMEIAGPYNAWRMILHNGGMLLATAIASIPGIPPQALLIGALVAALISGSSFLLLRVLRRASPTFVKGKPHLLHKKP